MKNGEFVAVAKALNITIGGVATIAEMKEFSTGSVGYYANGLVRFTLPGEATKGTFTSIAKDMPLLIDGMPALTATVKDFSTGSIGWNASGKIDIKLPNGQSVRCQVGLNLTVVKSKEMQADHKLGTSVKCQLGMNITVVGSKEQAA